MLKISRLLFSVTSVFAFIIASTALCQTSFTDVTSEAGLIDFNYSVGAAWGDYNNDGYPDIYLVNLGQGNVFYSNNGDGTFDDITAQSGTGDNGAGVGCAWGDYDNDGLLDLFASNRPGMHRLYRNLGDSSFIDMAPGYGMSDPTGWGESVAWADYDNDGFIDLYVLRMNQSNILYRNIDGGDFEDVTDIAGVGHYGPGEGVAWCDYDNDGDQDIYAVNAQGYNLLYRNNGDGTFSDYTDSAGIRHSGYSYGCSWGDYDNDGDFDLYVGRNGNNKLYRNNGDGTFEDAGAEAGVDAYAFTLGVAWEDYDNDGWLDLHLAVHQGDDILFRNSGDGTFEDVTAEAGVHNYYNGRGDIWGDYNNDGFPDLYVTNHDGSANVLFRNEGNNNHFLNVRLTGTMSNRSAIGSKIICVSGDLRMMRQVEGGSGFASQNSMEVHFGSGDNDYIDSLCIYWPSGAVQILTALQADQFLEITETETGVNENRGSIPDRNLLSGNYPNPFNSSTVIEYHVPCGSDIKLEIFNLMGQKITTLVNGHQAEGNKTIRWNAAAQPSGIYFCRLDAGNNICVRRMTLLK